MNQFCEDVHKLQPETFIRSEGRPNVILETSDAHLIHGMAEPNYAIGMTLQHLAKTTTTLSSCIL